MPKKTRRLGAALAAIPTVLLVVLLWLYAWSQSPLTPAEVDGYIERIESQDQTPGGRHDLPELRRFLANDDGKPFYTVNLYEFSEQAEYSEDQRDQISGEEAFARFSEIMLGLLAKRASHPILGSEWVDIASGWDRIVVVRYRSRRDIAEIFASPEFAEASAHKWAAIARNDRMLIQGLHLPELHVPATLLAFAGGVSALFWARSRRS